MSDLAPRIILYTKDPCSLCDDVKALLASMRETYPHTLEEVDITLDQTLFLKYRFSIPVLEFNFTDRETETLSAPITISDLIRVLS